jgi:hypothetical protein
MSLCRACIGSKFEESRKLAVLRTCWPRHARVRELAKQLVRAVAGHACLGESFEGFDLGA